MRTRRVAALIFLIPMMIVFFQNCSQSFVPVSVGNGSENSNSQACRNGETRSYYPVDVAAYPELCGAPQIDTCVGGAWTQEQGFPQCQQFCLNPASNQLVPADSVFFSYTRNQATTQTQCNDAMVVSTCMQSTGTFQPAPNSFSNCSVQGQTCSYPTTAGLARPSGNQTGSTVTGFLNPTATFPTTCGSMLTRTCQSNGNWNGSTPLFANCDQRCLHPDTNQSMSSGATYTYFTRQTGSAEECANAQHTSTCNMNSGLYEPMAPGTRYAICQVQQPPPPSGSTVRARMRATRLSGPAPLAVLFDASASTDTDPQTIDTFRQLTYNFDANDGNTAIYETSGLLKRRQSGGALFAYVFERPSSTPYRTRVRVKNPAGAWDITEVEISVQDPNVVFSGTNTLCIGSPQPVPGQEGCPAGAMGNTSLPNPFNWSNKRLLFRRGQTFPGFDIRGDVSNVQVGAFGTGAPPIFNSNVSVGANLQSNPGLQPRNIVIMDLHFTRAFYGPIAASDVLVLRCRHSSPPGNYNDFDFGGTTTEYFRNNLPSGWSVSQILNPRRLFYFENVVEFTGAFGMLIDSALVGNTFHAQAPAQHSVRIWMAMRSALAHNIFGRTGDLIRHSLKVHSGGLVNCSTLNVDAMTTAVCATHKVVVADNRLGETTNPNQWIAAFAPENTIERQSLEDIVIERNNFRWGPNTFADINLNGRRITERGNFGPQGREVVLAGVPGFPTGNCGSYVNIPSEWCGPYFLRQPVQEPHWP